MSTIPSETLKNKILTGMKAKREATKLDINPDLIKNHILNGLQNDVEDHSVSQRLENIINDISFNEIIPGFKISKKEIRLNDKDTNKQSSKLEYCLQISLDDSKDLCIDLEIPIKISFRNEKAKVDIPLESNEFKIEIIREKKVTLKVYDNLIVDNFLTYETQIGVYFDVLEQTNFLDKAILALEEIVDFSSTLPEDKKESFNRFFLNDDIAEIVESLMQAKNNPGAVPKSSQEFYAIILLSEIISSATDVDVHNIFKLEADFARQIVNYEVLDTNAFKALINIVNHIVKPSESDKTFDQRTATSHKLSLRDSIYFYPLAMGYVIAFYLKFVTKNKQVEEFLTGLTVLKKKFNNTLGVRNLPFDRDFWRYSINRKLKLALVENYNFNEDQCMLRLVALASDPDQFKNLMSVINNVLTLSEKSNEFQSAKIKNEIEDIEVDQDGVNDDPVIIDKIPEQSSWDAFKALFPIERVELNLKPKNDNRVIAAIYLKQITKIAAILAKNDWNPSKILRNNFNTSRGINFEKYKGCENIFTARITKQHRLQMKINESGKIEIFGICGHPAE